ncbi:MAG: class I SAM-dependent methyltransferase [Candidatus Heimdallarchaeota archaeon]|nr:MAG: class I SAM-dependent methyltransferase [Candidatus Heimdallarchaeota archaeon]
MQNDAIKVEKLTGVENTLFFPLLSRTLDAKSSKPILNDKKAVELLEKLDFDFLSLQKSLEKPAIIGHALRGRYFDDCVRSYIQRYPSGVVISLGSGLDTRFDRIDNGLLTFIDIDLPEVINVRRKLLSETLRNSFIGCSLFDYSWIAQIHTLISKVVCPVLFIAEAVFMYLPKTDVQSLFQKLSSSFPSSDIIFDVYTNFMVKEANKNIGLKEFQAEFKWGVNNLHDIEKWAPNLRLISEWSFFNNKEARMGMFKILRFIPFIKKMSRIVHFRFE